MVRKIENVLLTINCIGTYLLLKNINFLFKFINYLILGQIQMVQAHLPQRQQTTVSILAK